MKNCTDLYTRLNFTFELSDGRTNDFQATAFAGHRKRDIGYFQREFPNIIRGMIRELRLLDGKHTFICAIAATEHGDVSARLYKAKPTDRSYPVHALADYVYVK